MRIAVLVPLILIFLVPISALSHSGATGIVKERMDLMKEMSAAIKLLNKIVLANADLRTDDAQNAVKAILNHSRVLPEMFPIGSNTHPSEASSVIWEKRSDFNRSFEKMGTLASEFRDLVQSAADYDAVSVKFTELAFSCKSCHDTFKIEKH